MTATVQVLINGVEAGTLPSAQYQEIRRQSRHDFRVYCLQLIVIVKVALNILGRVFWGMPVAMLGMLILCLMSPGMIANAIQAFPAYSPQQLEKAVGLCVSYAAMLSFVSIIVGAMVSRAVRKDLGFENAFATESDRALRVTLGITTTGHIYAYEKTESQPSQQV